MKRKSHLAFGKILAQTYLQDISIIHKKAFLYGCIQPDQNPLTYLKGFFRFRNLRGHNYQNAEHFIIRIADRLDCRRCFSTWDYYTFGKLIHYTMDAFTYVHNAAFTNDLHNHRVYESSLQDVFLLCSHDLPNWELPITISSAEIIQWFHQIYICQPGTMEADSRFAIVTSCLITQNILIHN